jgi:hypothetical protein
MSLCISSELCVTLAVMSRIVVPFRISEPVIPSMQISCVHFRGRVALLAADHTTAALSFGAPKQNNQENKSVVATADKLSSSLRSGRLLSAVPHFKLSPKK